MGRRSAWALLVGANVVLAATLLTSCAGGTAPGMVVDLRTDYVPGVEFFQIRTRVSKGGLPASEMGWTNSKLVVSLQSDYLDAKHVAQYPKLGKGLFAVQVQLLDHGDNPVAEGRVLAEIKSGTQAVTVVITRDCRAVSCPGAGDSPSAVACLGGGCVDPRCTPETPDFCPMAQCTTATDCTAHAACSTPRCLGGVCLYAGDDSACPASQYCDPDMGCVDRPIAPPEGGPVDGGVDAGDPCAGVTCPDYNVCQAGTCHELPGCLSASECAAGEICQRRHCIPGTLDLDGDGVPAAMDCDETNPVVHEGATEICDGIDDDCDMMIDEGDPGLLCASDPSGGVCMDGTCGCPPGTYDFDRDPTNGCECTAMPDAASGPDCGSAIDLGDVSDSGQTVTVSGNVLPDDREVWYRFHAVDTPDRACDTFHVRAQFTADPDNRFELTVYKGDCSTPACDDAGYTDFSWATDFYDGAVGAPPGTGECPCAPDPGMPGKNVCADETSDFFVRVRRVAGSTVDCMGYTLEITNGVYSTM